MSTEFVIYSKPGCHLCEGLIEKLRSIERPNWKLDIRDITTREEWFDRYQYEIPVLCLKTDAGEKPLPRFSPRSTSEQIARSLEKYLEN